jgi:hypothetical protein
MTSISATNVEVPDDELMDDEPAELSWRGDPTRTLSDWTIVLSTSDESSRTYHVHKAVLAVGARSCRYFTTLFNAPAPPLEKQDCTSRITLDHRDTNVFPVMLDFLYAGALDVTADSAVALKSLARYFQCRELMKKVDEFLHKDLTLMTAHKYLRSASERSDEQLEESAKRLLRLKSKLLKRERQFTLQQRKPTELKPAEQRTCEA